MTDVTRELTIKSLEDAIMQVNTWLQQHFPGSLLGLSDRLIVRTLYDKDKPADISPELTDIMTIEADLHKACSILRERDQLDQELPAMLIILWSFEHFQGLQNATWRELLASTTKHWAKAQEEEPEPFRSAALYWAHVMGWWEDFEIGPSPRDKPHIHRMYHATHAIYYHTMYGTETIAQEACQDDVSMLLDGWRQYPDNADLLAEVLLAMLAIRPLDKVLCMQLAQTLITTQREDGGFQVPGGEEDHHHHSSCVAWLALSRLRDIWSFQ